MSPTSISKWAIAGTIIGGTLISSGIDYAQAQTTGGTSTAPSATKLQPVSTTPGLVSNVTSTEPCTNCFGVIDPDGTIIRQNGVISVTRLSAGTYDIRFDAQIGECAWLATIGLGIFGGVPTSGEVVVTGRTDTNNGLFLRTFNSTSIVTDRPFHVALICNTTTNGNTTNGNTTNGTNGP
jgi:hypothetical protein